MPGFISPKLATLKSKAPVGSKWFHEIKYDGCRLQINLNKGAQSIPATDTTGPSVFR
jgi:bifunctional non-homologous end joining protein LigD